MVNRFFKIPVAKGLLFFKKYYTYLLIGLLVFLIAIPVEAQQKLVSAITLQEAEDHEFIRNLYKDKYYIFAREEADEYLLKYPDGLFRAEMAYIVAQIAMINKNFKKSLKNYQHLLKQYPASPYIEDTLYYAGIVALNIKKEALAQKYLYRLLKKYRKTKYFTNAHFILGGLAFDHQKWKEAETNFKKIVKKKDASHDNQLTTQNLLAWAQYFQGKTKDAKKRFSQILTTNISDISKSKIAYQLAIEAQKEKNFRMSIHWHKALIQKWPTPKYNDKSRFWIAEAYFQIFQKNPTELTLKEKKKAISLYSENIQLKKPVELVNSHYHRGWLYMNIRQIKKAEKDFSWLQENDLKFAKDVDLTIIRADYFENRKKWDQANQIYAFSLKHQTQSKIRNVILIKTIRNHFRLKMCSGVIEHANLLDYKIETTNLTEIFYYTGKCRIANKQWKKADLEFAKIPVKSDFTPLIFEDYLFVFQEINDLNRAVVYLDQVLKNNKKVPVLKALLFKAEFSLELNRLVVALETMLQIVKISPDKKNDPWFLLNVAKNADRIAVLMDDQQWRKSHPTVKPLRYYENKALVYYERAFPLLTKKELETKLSVLEILGERLIEKKKYQKLVGYYEKMIGFIGKNPQHDRLILQIAHIQINQLNQKNPAVTWLYKLHGKRNSVINYEASVLLAEVLIDQKKPLKAIKIFEELAQQPINKTSWYAIVHFRLGELYQSNEKWLKSIKHYRAVSDSTGDKLIRQKAITRSFEIEKYLKQKQK